MSNVALLSARDIYRLTVPERQFLPLGHPGTPASLGGLLVTNTSGFKRARYGGMRDLVLGVRVALPDGALVHGGVPGGGVRGRLSGVKIYADRFPTALRQLLTDLLVIAWVYATIRDMSTQRGGSTRRRAAGLP